MSKSTFIRKSSFKKGFCIPLLPQLYSYSQLICAVCGTEQWRNECYKNTCKLMWNNMFWNACWPLRTFTRRVETKDLGYTSDSGRTLYPAWWVPPYPYSLAPLTLGPSVLLMKTFNWNYLQPEGISQCKEALKGNELWGQNKTTVSSYWRK